MLCHELAFVRSMQLAAMQCKVTTHIRGRIPCGKSRGPGACQKRYTFYSVYAVGVMSSAQGYVVHEGSTSVFIEAAFGARKHRPLNSLQGTSSWPIIRRKVMLVWVHSMDPHTALPSRMIDRVFPWTKVACKPQAEARPIKLMSDIECRDTDAHVKVDERLVAVRRRP